MGFLWYTTYKRIECAEENIDGEHDGDRREGLAQKNEQNACYRNEALQEVYGAGCKSGKCTQARTIFGCCTRRTYFDRRSGKRAKDEDGREEGGKCCFGKEDEFNQEEEQDGATTIAVEI
jgi:hypothetical protein